MGSSRGHAWLFYFLLLSFFRQYIALTVFRKITFIRLVLHFNALKITELQGNAAGSRLSNLTLEKNYASKQRRPPMRYFWTIRLGLLVLIYTMHTYRLMLIIIIIIVIVIIWCIHIIITAVAAYLYWSTIISSNWADRVFRVLGLFTPSAISTCASVRLRHFLFDIYAIYNSIARI